MAINTITYANKSAIYTNASIPDTNKVNDSDMNEIKTVVNTNANLQGDLSNLTTTDKTSIVNAINETVTNYGNTNGKILWSNQNPTSSFSDQNILLNSSDYDCYEVIFRMKTDLDRTVSSGKVLKGTGTVCTFAIKGNYYRWINYTDDTTLAAATGRNTPAGSTTESTDNSWCIPIYVIGYKTGLFS